MKVVFDTNVLVSALLVKIGTQAKLLQQVQRGTHGLILSEDIFAELRRVLHYPRIRKAFPKMTEEDIEKYERQLKIIVLVMKNLPQFKVIKQDPKDDHILACALVGKADYIVTGDRHLLDLKVWRKIPIVSPAEFLKIAFVNR